MKFNDTECLFPWNPAVLYQDLFLLTNLFIGMFFNPNFKLYKKYTVRYIV